MNIGSIIWPSEATAACQQYLKFVIRVVEGYGIVFPGPRASPLQAAQAYIAGTVSEDEYRAEAIAWWDELDSQGGIREFRERASLLIRLALCLLSATPDEAPRLGEHLSWFFQVLGFMGLDVREPIKMMRAHFASAAS